MPIDTECFEKVSLFITATNLPKASGTFGSTARPFAVLFEVDPNSSRLNPKGTTEVIPETCDPTWTTSFELNYHFEAIQEFVIKIFHSDGSTPTSNLAKHTPVGDVRFTLSTLMTASSQTLKRFFNAKTEGEVTIKGEVMHHTRDNFVVTFSCNKLANKEGFFGTSDPFLRISRSNEDNSFTAVWQNNHVDNSLNPRWAETKIAIVTLCNGDIDRPLKIEVFDHEKSGKHTPMGEVLTSVRELLSSGGAPLSVIEPAKAEKKGKKYTNSGTLHATHCYIEENPTFSDFIVGGCEISLVVAIDFTASNGDPLSQSSLHYIDPTGHLNSYQQAIQAVGQVLEPYDSDHMYPVYGFGAKVRQPDGKLSPAQHCFPVYGGGLEVQGVEGILQAYKDCLESVVLSGPTLFGPLVNATCQRASSLNCSQEKQAYEILLILTDGVINDFEATKSAIIAASRQPLSIIIVGVGNADFSEMHMLDSDKQLLSHNGVTATRDIVQFVSFKEQVLKGNQSLAEAVLAEIPGQLLTYMKQNGIKPNKAKN